MVYALPPQMQEHVCHIIGDWYLSCKELFLLSTDERTHTQILVRPLMSILRDEFQEHVPTPIMREMIIRVYIWAGVNEFDNPDMGS